MKECMFRTTNSGDCPQQILGRDGDYCYYHSKLLAGHIEPSEPDAWEDLQEEKARSKARQ